MSKLPAPSSYRPVPPEKRHIPVVFPSTKIGKPAATHLVSSALDRQPPLPSKTTISDEKLLPNGNTTTYAYEVEKRICLPTVMKSEVHKKFSSSSVQQPPALNGAALAVAGDMLPLKLGGGFLQTSRRLERPDLTAFKNSTYKIQTTAEVSDNNNKFPTSFTSTNESQQYPSSAVINKSVVNNKSSAVNGYHQGQQYNGNNNNAMYITTTDSSGSAADNNDELEDNVSVDGEVEAAAANVTLVNTGRENLSRKFQSVENEDTPKAKQQQASNNFQSDVSTLPTSPISFACSKNIKTDANIVVPYRPVTTSPTALRQFQHSSSYDVAASEEQHTVRKLPPKSSFIAAAAPATAATANYKSRPTLSMRHLERKQQQQQQSYGMDNNATVLSTIMSESDTQHRSLLPAVHDSDETKGYRFSAANNRPLNNRKFVGNDGDNNNREEGEEEQHTAVREADQHPFQRTYSTGSGTSVGNSIRIPVRHGVRPFVLPLPAANSHQQDSSSSLMVPKYSSSSTTDSDSHYAVPSNVHNNYSQNQRVILKPNRQVSSSSSSQQQQQQHRANRPPVSDNAINIIQEMFRLCGMPLDRSTVKLTAELLNNGDADVDALADTLKIQYGSANNNAAGGAFSVRPHRPYDVHPHQQQYQQQDYVPPNNTYNNNNFRATSHFSTGSSLSNATSNGQTNINNKAGKPDFQENMAQPRPTASNQTFILQQRVYNSSTILPHANLHAAMHDGMPPLNQHATSLRNNYNHNDSADSGARDHEPPLSPGSVLMTPTSRRTSPSNAYERLHRFADE